MNATNLVKVKRTLTRQEACGAGRSVCGEHTPWSCGRLLCLPVTARSLMTGAELPKNRVGALKSRENGAD